MRGKHFYRNWSIGGKTMASHLLIAILSILTATVLCFIFVYNYSRANVINELERQVIAICAKESNADISGVATRDYVVDMYQSLTNSSVFFVDMEGDAIEMRRYEPDGLSFTEGPTSYNADSEDTNSNDFTGDVTVAPEIAGDDLASDDSDASETEETTETESSNGVEYSVIELFDTIDQQFVNRVLSGETVTAVQSFSFAGGVIVFAGSPIVNQDGDVIGGVILAQPVSIMRSIGWELALSMVIGASVAIVLAILLAVAQTRMLVRPIQRMTSVTRGMAEGDYGYSVPITSGDEIGELGRTLNTLSLKLLETIESLKEERDRLELVISSIEEGILAVDREMQVVHSNMSFLELMELENIEEMKKSDRTDVRNLAELMRTVIVTGESGKLQWMNPSQRAILAEVTALSDGNEQIGAVCLLSDVSEAQRIEQLRRDYVANISHELRTPLTGIRGMIEPLMDGYVETEEERMNCYSVIQKETIRLEKLVIEMLDMSRLQDGKVTVELETLELPGILEAAARSVQSIAQSTGVNLSVETDGSRLECLGNEDRITQVLVIFLDNALDFTPSGGSVTVFARDEGKQVVVGVRDTGCGIEPKDIPMIWERFYKVDRSRLRTKGTGLGLSIAKLTVELMGGKIAVKSEVGVGSEFYFTLNKK